MADNQFAEFDNIDYHDNLITAYYDQLLATGRNLGMNDDNIFDFEDAIFDLLETDFENANPGLKLYYALYRIHRVIANYLEMVRNSNQAGDTERHLLDVAINDMNRFHDVVSPHLTEMVHRWIRYRLDTFHNN